MKTLYKIYIFTLLYSFFQVALFAQKGEHTKNYFIVTSQNDTFHISIDTQYIKQIDEIAYPRIRDTSYLDLSVEDRLFIKEEVMRRHLEYMAYFHEDSRKAKRRQHRICRLLQNKFVDYTEIFETQTRRSRKKISDTTSIQIPEAFHIRPYNSIHYNSIKYYPPILPDTLQSYKISFIVWLISPWVYEQGHSYMDLKAKHDHINKYIYPYMPAAISILSDDPVLDDIYYSFIFRYFTLRPNDLETCKLLKIQYVVDGVWFKKYICYSNTDDNKSVYFIYYSDRSILESFINNNFTAAELPVQYQRERHNFIKKPEVEHLDHENLFEAYQKGELEKFTGLIDYANLIASEFIPTWANGQVLDYKDGYYTIEVTGLLSRFCENLEVCCKRPFIESYNSLYNSFYLNVMHYLRGMHSIRRLVLYEHKLCSNPEKEIPWRMHIKINPETGNIQLKIVEMLDISKMPWCPN